MTGGRAHGVPDRQPRGRAANFQTVGHEDWTSRAKCRDMNVSEADLLFHPPAGNGYGPATRYCTGKRDADPCPVQSECLAYALRTETEDRYRNGCWGATTPAQRSLLMKTA